MAGAATLAIAGFTALGSIFDYPSILKEPTADILTAFREQQTAVTGWFLVLIISAALLAPIGVLLGRIAGGRLGTWITGLGVAAATVQVIGLVPVGAAHPGQSATTPPCPPTPLTPTAPSNSCTPGSAPSSAKPSATPSPRPSLSWSSSP